MITRDQKAHAYTVLRAAGIEPGQVRELLAGPKDLRDEFAGRAMAALVTESDIRPEDRRTHTAFLSYQMADEMMKRRAE